MELNITELFNTIEPSEYSASCAELGQDAGRITWNHSKRDAKKHYLLNTQDKKDAFKRFVKDSGGWSQDEIDTWNCDELNALCLQWIAGDMREGNLYAGMTDDEWREYETGSEEGRYSSRIYGGPLSIDGQVYFMLD